MNDEWKGVIESHFVELRRCHPNFRLTFREADAVVTGFFRLSIPEEQKSIVHECRVSIFLSERYPHELPTVKEFGGLIPKDFHTNPSGDLCLGVATDLWLTLNGKLTLIEFVEKCVASFFHSSLQKEKTGRVVRGERSHGTKGILEFFEEHLSCDGQRLLRILYAIRRNSLNAEVSCPCGSTRPYESCCKHSVDLLLRSCPRQVMDRDIDESLLLLLKKKRLKRRLVVYGFYGGIRQAMLAEMPRPKIRLDYRATNRKIKKNDASEKTVADEQADVNSKEILALK